jgi:hypothetical protein
LCSEPLLSLITNFLVFLGKKWYSLAKIAVMYHAGRKKNLLLEMIAFSTVDGHL